MLSEIDTPGRSPSPRHEFSGSKMSNSTYSPRRMDCLVLRGTWATRSLRRRLDGVGRLRLDAGLGKKARDEVRVTELLSSCWSRLLQKLLRLLRDWAPIAVED